MNDRNQRQKRLDCMLTFEPAWLTEQGTDLKLDCASCAVPRRSWFFWLECSGSTFVAVLLWRTFAQKSLGMVRRIQPSDIDELGPGHSTRMQELLLRKRFTIFAGHDVTVQFLKFYMCGKYTAYAQN